MCCWLFFKYLCTFLTVLIEVFVLSVSYWSRHFYKMQLWHSRPAVSSGMTGHRYPACYLSQSPIYDSTISNYIKIAKTTIQNFVLCPNASDCEATSKVGRGGGGGGCTDQWLKVDRLILEPFSTTSDLKLFAKMFLKACMDLQILSQFLWKCCCAQLAHVKLQLNGWRF